MAFRIQLRRDVSSKWKINNPVLLLGEPGLETDTNKMKIGDGVLAWNSLPYWITSNATPSTYTGTFSITTTFDSGGNLINVNNSKGPDGTSLTGSVWNFDVSVGDSNDLYVTHNTGRLITSLNIQGLIMGGGTKHHPNAYFITSPNGTSDTSYSLMSDLGLNTFIINGLTTDNTGAGVSSTANIVWTFGGTAGQTHVNYSKEL